VLSRQEAAALLAARHRPAFALAVLTELAEGAPLRETHRARVDENYTGGWCGCLQCGPGAWAPHASLLPVAEGVLRGPRCTLHPSCRSPTTKHPQ
jgi:hypothetical protein